MKIDNVNCVGDCFALQGYFRAGLDLQGLAVDKSGTSTNGNVYVTWHDGRKFQITNLESPNGIRTEHVNVNELFDRMTRYELEAYARDGNLPDWFTQAVGVTQAHRQREENDE